jgi:phage terminase small subunit
MTELSPKQEAFAQEYVADLNAAAAARRAGYSEHTADRQGYRLLRNAEVSHRIAELQAQAAERAAFDATRVLVEIERLATVDVVDVVTWGTRVRTVYRDGKGRVLDDTHLAQALERGDLVEESTVEEAYVLPKDSADLPRHVTAAISSVSLDKNGNIKITMHQKTRALELAARHFKMLTDVMEIRDQTPLDVQLRRAIERKRKGETDGPPETQGGA